MHCYFLFCACCWPAAAEQPARYHPIPRKDLLRQIRLRRRQLPVPRSPKSFRMMKFRAVQSHPAAAAIADGTIIGADYEVDEEWLDRLGGSPVTLEEAKQVVQSKVSGSSTENIRMWEESDDGRGRFEGELYHNGIKYEFEIDPKTGIIFDWNADLRE